MIDVDWKQLRDWFMLFAAGLSVYQLARGHSWFAFFNAFFVSVYFASPERS